MTGWKLAATVPDGMQEAAQAAFEPFAEAVAAFEIGEGDAPTTVEHRPGAPWRIEAYAKARPDRVAVETALALAAASARVAVPDLEMAPLDPVDWVAENRKAFPPQRIGRVWLQGSHVTAPPPPGLVPLTIDFGVAFGSGEHATTQGCLLAIQALAKRRPLRRALDMGCGTGVLGLAALKLHRRAGGSRGRRPRAVLADIDRDAARVAGANARLNRLAPWTLALQSPGYAHRAVRAHGRYDLVLANILARPLCAMAGDLARHLAPGGRAVLSGLLARQERQVLAAHRARGLILRARIARDGWHTLILARSSHGLR